MKMIIRSALLTGIVLGLALPLMGCGGEELKPGPGQGGASAGPPPKTEAEYHERDQAAQPVPKKPGAGKTRPAR